MAKLAHIVSQNNNYLPASYDLERIWHPDCGTDSSAPFPLTTTSPPFKFVLPIHSENIRVSHNDRLIERKSDFHTRGENVVHLSRPLGVGQRLCLRIGPSTRKKQSSPAFQIGFTLCDLTDQFKIQEHLQSCGRHAVCKHSFAQTVAPFATTGSLVVVERTDRSIEILVQNGCEERKYGMKFSTGPKEEADYISPNRVYYPFVVLSGNAESLRIVCPDQDPESEAGIQFPSPGSPDQAFRFLITSYPNVSVSIHNDRQVVCRTKEQGSRIVYLDQKLLLGSSLTLQTHASSGLSLPFSYEFGAVTCESSSIFRWDYHIREVCDEDRGCGLKSLRVTLRNCSDVGDRVFVTRNHQTLTLVVGEGPNRKRFLKHIPRSVDQAEEWQPFLILSGDVDAIQIMDSYTPHSGLSSRSASVLSDPVQSDTGLREAAERLINSLDDSPKKLTIERPVASRPMPVPAAPKPLSEGVRWASLITPDAQFTHSPPIHTNNSQYRFFQPTYLKEVSVLQSGKWVRLTGDTGIHIIYMSRPFTSDLLLAMKVEREVPEFRSKSHSFVFGFTTCDKDKILRHATHAKSFCNSSCPCAGVAYYHSIPSNAHTGSVVYFERKNGLVTITIAGVRSWRIESLRMPITDVPVYPFVELSGGVNEISIMDADSVPSAPSGKEVSLTEPRFAISVPRNESYFSSANKDSDYDLDDDEDDRFMFMNVPYSYNGIEISENNTKVRRTARIGSRHVYFNREIEIGMSVEFKVTAGSGKIGPYRFEFGFTSCSRRSILQDDRHMYDICSRAQCKGFSHTVGLKYIPHLIKLVTITRQRDLFVIDAGVGTNHKRFFKHLPDGATPADRWFPFLTLTGDVEEVQISDYWTRTPQTRRTSVTGVSQVPVAVPVSDPQPIPQQKTAHLPPRVCIPDPVSPPVVPAYVPVAQQSASVHPITRNNHHSVESNDSFERGIRSHVPHMIMTSKPSAKPFADKAPVVPNDWPEVFDKKLTLSNNHNNQTESSLVVVSAPKKPAPTSDPKRTDFPKRKWFSNTAVVFEDPILRLVDESESAKAYIFSTKILLNETIAFKAISLTPNGNQNNAAPKLAFGLTSRSLFQLDVKRLPDDASVLNGSAGSEWFVFPNLMTCIGVMDGLVIKRTSTGISLMLGDSEHEIIAVDGNIVLYPFFQLNGCSVQILPHA